MPLSVAPRTRGASSSLGWVSNVRMVIRIGAELNYLWSLGRETVIWQQQSEHDRARSALHVAQTNANLAIKGVIALGAYAQLMEFKGDTVSATKYRKIAENYTSYWQSHAKSSDGSHYKLAYDMDDSTWSQK
jgi:hypothetical protein